MEPELFYWTGKIIWYAICASVCAAVGGITFIAPIVATHKVIKHLWKWRISAELAKYGFTEADIRFTHSLQGGGLPCEYDRFIEAVQRIKERGDAIKASK